VSTVISLAAIVGVGSATMAGQWVSAAVETWAK